MPKCVDNKIWAQYAVTISCVMSIFMAGITTGWLSPTLPKLLSKDHPLHLTADDVSNVAIISQAGNIIGIVLFTSLADIIGRKKVLLVAVLPQIGHFFMLNFSSSSVYILYVARIIGGISEGGCSAVAPIYIGEISEPKIRGALLSLYSFFWLFGSLFIDIVGTYLSIETTSLICLFFPLLFLSTFSFAPESPYYSLMKNKPEEARRAIKLLRCDKNSEREFAELCNDVKRQMSETGRYKDIFLIKSNRNSFLTIGMLSFIDTFSGLSVLESYAQVFFQKNTKLIPQNFASSLMTLLALLSTAVSSVIVDRVGRKRLLLCSIAILGFFLSILSVYFFIIERCLVDPLRFSWIPLVIVVFLDINYNVGVSNISSCLNGEIFSVTVKNKCTCATSIIYAISLAISTKLYQTLETRVGTGLPMAIFSVCQFFGFWYTWKFIPETSGKTLEQIQLEIKYKRGHTSESCELKRLRQM